MLQIIASVGSVGERIENRRLGLRHHEHVALVDRLPAANAGAVEAQAVFEHVLCQLVDRNREVLPDAGKIHEPQVDRLDVPFRGTAPRLLWVSRFVPFVCGHDRSLLANRSEMFLASQRARRQPIEPLIRLRKHWRVRGNTADALSLMQAARSAIEVGELSIIGFPAAHRKSPGDLTDKQSTPSGCDAAGRFRVPSEITRTRLTYLMNSISR